MLQRMKEHEIGGNMKQAAMILEGGAVRGVFSSGVLDYLMEQGLYLPHVIGVSAGSCNAVDYVSRQPGRTRDCVIRTGKEDGKLINLKKAVRNKSLFDMDLLFEIDPNEKHPFDYTTFFESDMTCEIVVTNCLTGQAEYLQEKSNRTRLMRICRASSSIPVLSPMVFIDGIPYLDGGVADSIPLLHAMQQGFRKNVLVLTRNRGYRKTISRKGIAFYKTYLRRYPKLARAVCLRPYHYNRIMTYIEKWEEEGKIFVIRPQVRTVSRTETNPETLMAFYKHGYEQMNLQYEALLDYLKK